MPSPIAEMRPTHKFDLLKPQWSLDEQESRRSPYYIVIYKAATNRADHKQSRKDRVQAASEGAIHGTSSRKESDDALGRVVVQRAANGNDREECSQLLCLRLGESMHAY
jgi:hypothetical protein